MAKIVRKDKMLAGYNGNLESVIIHDADGKAVESHNGVFVVLGGLMEGQREVQKATLATKEDFLAGKDILLVHNGEVMADERLDKVEDYVIKEGKVARAYRLFGGDIFTLTVDLFDAEPTVGEEVAPLAGGLLGDTDTNEGAKYVFKVFEDSGYELHRNTKAYAVQVELK